MSSPEVILTYPDDGDTGIPVGITLLVYFDKGVDLESVTKSIVLFGRDFDMTSGPGSALHIDRDTGDNPFFLTSPGFNGVIPIKVALAYYTLDTTTIVDPGIITSEADEVTANVGHVAQIILDTKYNTVLPEDATLILSVGGDPDSQGVGISTRTVYDLEADSGNTGNGSLVIYGTWTGESTDSINIEITTAGSIGTAKYKWWYTSAGVGSATTGVVTNLRYRTLADGLQIRFTPTLFAVGDKWSFNVQEVQRLEESYKITFTTNDGSYTTAPSSPSTPATSTPAPSILPVNGNEFRVLSMIPESGVYNVSVKNRKIIITFSDAVDEDTITLDSVKLYKYHVDGDYDETYSPTELQKTLEIEDNILTIRF